MTETTDPATPGHPTLFDAFPDDPAVDDLAAEADDAVPADAGDDPDDDEDEPGFSGVCRGGPYDGRTVISRFDGGFMLFDKPGKRFWTYVRHPTGEYMVSGDGTGNTLADMTALRAAADGIQYDVIAYDDGPALA